VRSSYLVVFAFLIGVTALAISIFAEAPFGIILGTAVTVVAVSPAIEEALKAGLTVYAGRHSAELVGGAYDVRWLAILVGFAFGAAEGMGYLYLYFDKTIGIELFASSIFRIAPIHAVTTYSAVAGIKSAKPWFGLLGILAAISLHEAANLVAVLNLPLGLVGVEWVAISTVLAIVVLGIRRA
jgi:hypothetical protein